MPAPLIPLEDQRVLLFWAAAAILALAIGSILYELAVSGRLS